MNNEITVAGSSALEDPTYWWFQVRARIFPTYFSQHLGKSEKILDVGSSNSPSSQWLRAHGEYIPMDLDPRGLPPEGVVGSVTDIPFDPESLDVVAAFDIIEHISDEELALQEIYRVLKPGGRFLISVPAYEWAWSSNDVHNEHFRRYTRKRMERALKREGFVICKSSYVFTATFPLFVLNILLSNWRERNTPPQPLAPGEVRELPATNKLVDKVLYKLSAFDEARLRSGRSLPFGSSLVVLAEKPRA